MNTYSIRSDSIQIIFIFLKDGSTHLHLLSEWGNQRHKVISIWGLWHVYHRFFRVSILRASERYGHHHTAASAMVPPHPAHNCTEPVLPSTVYLFPGGKEASAIPPWGGCRDPDMTFLCMDNFIYGLKSIELLWNIKHVLSFNIEKFTKTAFLFINNRGQNI